MRGIVESWGWEKWGVFVGGREGVRPRGRLGWKRVTSGRDPACGHSRYHQQRRTTIVVQPSVVSALVHGKRMGLLRMTDYQQTTN